MGSRVKYEDEEEFGDSVKKEKITMGFSKTFSSAKSTQEKKSLAPISIKLGAQVKSNPS